MDYMKIEKIITPSQHGFVPNKACITNLLETLDTITDAVNKGYSVDLTLLDLAKAFDKVSHKKLIFKLKNLICQYFQVEFQKILELAWLIQYFGGKLVAMSN